MQTNIIKVAGMTCGGCTSKVTSALKKVAGVRDVQVSLPAGEAAVQYDEHVTSPQELRSAVTAAGYGVDAGEVRAQSKGGCCAPGGGSS